MTDPPMFETSNPLLDRFGSLAFALPDATEEISHEHPAFCTTKEFAYFGASVKVDGTYVQHERTVLVLLDDDDRCLVGQGDRGFVPGYLGASGWIGLDLDDRSD